MNHEKRILDRTVKAYCRLGNGTLAAKEAVYKNSPSLVKLESQLKKKRSAEKMGLHWNSEPHAIINQKRISNRTELPPPR